MSKARELSVVPNQSPAFKNRIINGAMIINQRNAGASVTIPSAAQTYTLDRWYAQSFAASKFSIQRNAGSIEPPAGFTNYLGLTSLAATSPASTEYYGLVQTIEGFNIADLGWGTVNAQAVTLSFKVYSSLTGTFSGAISNGSRSYPFTYSVSVANTWTPISVPIVGDPTGTWAIDNTAGMLVRFNIGTGSSFLSSSANSWQVGNYYGTTSSVSIIGTNGATFYITGVQLEKGSNATSFDYRPYGTELQLCQRYYEKSYNTDVVPGTATNIGAIISFTQLNNNFVTGGGIFGKFGVTKRANPTVTAYSSDGTSGQMRNDNNGTNTAATVDLIGMNGFRVYSGWTAQAAVNLVCQYTASAEL